MAGHWYNHDGNLYGQVPTQKGGWRDFDLRDARKTAALPSVTTILSLLAKPGLVRWQVEQGIKAAWQIPAPNILWPETEALKEAFRKSEEYTRWTQDFGTATHWWLNKKLRSVETIEIPPMIPGSEECADGILDWCAANEYSFELTEHRFARRDLGYAGTVDLIGTRIGVPAIIDIKTQEPPLTPYLEHALQLAGYDYALPWMGELMAEAHQHSLPDGTIYLCESVHRERISLIANRAQVGEIKEHIWLDPGSTIEATNERYNRIWLGLVELWMGINRYDPRQGVSS